MATPAWVAGNTKDKGNGSGITNKPRLPGIYENVRTARQKMARMRFVMHVPLDLRLHAWFWSWLALHGQPDAAGRVTAGWPRCMRVIRWCSVRYPNMRSFLIAFWGPRVDGERFAERMLECRTCDSLRVVLRSKPTETHGWHCGACSCPRWPLSELKRKNRMAKWYCPRQKHEGPYPGDWSLALMNGWVDEESNDGRSSLG